MIKSIDEIIDNVIRTKSGVPTWLTSIMLAKWANDAGRDSETYLEFVTCFRERAIINLRTNPDNEVAADTIAKADIAQAELARRALLSA